MRQVPMQGYLSIEDSSIQSENQEERLYYQYRHPYLKALSYAQAFGAEIGNFATSYFSLLATANVLTEIIADVRGNSSIELLEKLACYLFATVFAVPRLFNDLLLIIPAENFQTIYEKLQKIFYAPQESKDDTDHCLKKIFSYLLQSIIYGTFIILSADGAAGYMQIFHLPVLIKYLGIPIAAIGTLLGVSYAHFYYTDIISESFEFFKTSLSNPCTTLKSIFSNFCISLYILKIFIAASIYYSIIAAFYANSVITILQSVFLFKNDNSWIITFMFSASSAVFISNFFIRFLPIKNMYLNDEFQTIPEFYKKNVQTTQTFYKRIFFEFIICLAGIIFSINYFTHNNLTIALGIMISTSIFLISIPALHQYHRQHLALKQYQESQQLVITTYDTKTAKIINTVTRIQKSQILLFAGIWNVQNMFKNSLNYDLNLGLLDCACLVIFLGVNIGINKTATDIEKLNKHINLIKTKWTLGRFGTWGSLFQPIAVYPPKEARQLMQAVGKTDEPSAPLLEL